MISAKHLPLETVEVYLKIVKESETYSKKKNKKNKNLT